MTVPRQIILASKSPRRRSLVKELNINVVCVDTNFEESTQKTLEDPRNYVMRLAIDKADSISSDYPKALIIGADTTVVLSNRVMGKPQNSKEASEMLNSLRGKTHKVLTGVTVLDVITGRYINSVVSSLVSMHTLSTELISDYVKSGSPMDKAGAYGIQDNDFDLATVLQGCYNNVVGLPLCTLSEMLRKFQITPRIDAPSMVTINCHDCPLNKAYTE